MNNFSKVFRKPNFSQQEELAPNQVESIKLEKPHGTLKRKLKGLKTKLLSKPEKYDAASEALLTTVEPLAQEYELKSPPASQSPLTEKTEENSLIRKIVSYYLIMKEKINNLVTKIKERRQRRGYNPVSIDELADEEEVAEQFRRSPFLNLSLFRMAARFIRKIRNYEINHANDEPSEDSINAHQPVDDDSHADETQDQAQLKIDSVNGSETTLNISDIKCNQKMTISMVIQHLSRSDKKIPFIGQKCMPRMPQNVQESHTTIAFEDPDAIIAV